MTPQRTDGGKDTSNLTERGKWETMHWKRKKKKITKGFGKCSTRWRSLDFSIFDHFIPSQEVMGPGRPERVHVEDGLRKYLGH